MDNVSDVSAPLLALLVACLTMAALWAMHLRSSNASVVDVGWVFLVGALAVAFAMTSAGWTWRRLAVAASMAAWSARLGTYLLRDRVAGKPEDARYAELRRTWGRSASARFFWFFQLQAVAAVFFAVPAFVASANPRIGFSGLELAALALWVCAFAGELVADRQLEGFKANRSNRGRTCRVGLWRFSRHPNYFFEWLLWVANALFAVSSPGGTLALLCPAVMLFLLFRVTGIPATEAQALRSRGDDYRDYQRTTNAFFPWIPRS